MAVFTTNRIPVDSYDAEFFKSVGARIASARKVQGLTQTQLADELGLAQQTLAHYEGGRRCFPASMLSRLAEKLGIAPEELLGAEERPKGKRGPAPKLQQQIERIHQLPKAQQRFVMQMLDTVIAQAGHGIRHT